MKKQNKLTVAVIGAGVVGICTAIELQQAGFRVTLFDKDEPAKQTSFGNAAYIAAEYSEPLASPQNITAALLHTFSHKSAFKITADHFIKFIPWGLQFVKSARQTANEHSRVALNQLNRQSIESWKRILKLSGHSQMLQKNGYLKLWEKPSDLSAAKKAAENIKCNGHESILLQGEALYDEEPSLARNFNHGLYFPNGHQLTGTYEVCLKLFDYFQKQGGEFYRDGVNRLVAVDAGVKLQTMKDDYNFDKAIISAGIWSKQLVEDLGINIPLAAERGYHLTLPKISQTPRHILESTDRHVVLSSLQTGLRIVGFGEYGNINSKPIEKRYLQLQHHLSKIIKDIDYQQQPIETWMGIRPTLPDSLPVIDLHPQHPQIGMVFGHHHLGVTQAAISAQIISGFMSQNSLTENKHSIINLRSNPYSVSRFKS